MHEWFDNKWLKSHQAPFEGKLTIMDEPFPWTTLQKVEKNP